MVVNTRKSHGHTAVNTAARPAHSTQHTAHSTQHTAHSTQHKAHSTQHTAHSTQHTAHSTQHTAHSTQHTAHSTHIVHTSHKGTSPVDSRSGVVRKLELRKTIGLKKWAMSATEDHSLGRVESGE